MQTTKKHLILGTFIATSLFAVALVTRPGSGGQPASSNEPATTPTSQQAEKEVKAAVSDLIASVEKHDFRRLFEFYMPVEALRDLRRGPGVQAVADEAAKRAKTKAGLMEEFLKPFRAALKVKPKFNADKTEATFEIVIVPEQTISASRVPILAVRNANPKVTGYGADLAAVIKKATADLESGKADEYFNRLLPISELKLNDVNALAKRFKASPASVKQAVADLKSLNGKTPNFEDGGNTAIFEIPVAPPRGRDGKRGPKIPPRVFKFQKVSGNWRLYDNTTAMQAVSKGFSRKIPAETKTVVMEKIGSNWRIAPDSEFAGSRSGRRTSRKSYSRGYKTESKTFERPRFRRDEEKTEKTSPRR